MYGYEPPKREPEAGSWGEILMVIRLVFVEIARPLGFLVLTLALLMSIFVLLFSHPVYALLPIAGLGAIIWWFIRRDRQRIRDAEDALPR